MKGMLIAIEGIDGTGKSTQARLIGQALEYRGYEVVRSREPTDGPYGTAIRRTAVTGRLKVHDEINLFLKDRRQHVHETIAPALAAGKVVILDRYYFSNMAYQGPRRGADPGVIRWRNEMFAPRPGVLLILDLPIEKALERIGGRGARDGFEGLETLKAVQLVFRKLLPLEYAYGIDASGSPEGVCEMALSRIIPELDRRGVPRQSIP